ncbi:type II restriction enzyme, methylase [Candidatus Vecturithrix granuli]|uniref:Type II restriction enzyme, methylase n=1 Tax=Vecturithrix granuli TaxID=1499967 RepID=A0A081C0I1_VECG1|nr:type II restriction enzyme, methylase [Candidatus Vecturithrix granuli]
MVGKPLAEVKVVFVERLPLIISSAQKNFIIKAENMLELNKHFYTGTQKFLRFIESSYHPKTLSTKLQAFHTLDFSEFVTELKKQNVKLSKQEEFGLLDLFEAQKNHALDLQEQIEQTDQKIDRMVYELYGLTEEEIWLVEGKS